MKILKFFIIFFAFNTYLDNVSAQLYPLPPKDDFYIPSYETAPTREKLPPLPAHNINQTYNSPTAQYDVKYKLVNGVYVPTYTKKVIKKQPTPNIPEENGHPLIKNDIAATPELKQYNIESINTNDDSSSFQPLKPKAVIEVSNSAPIQKPISGIAKISGKEITIDKDVPPYRYIYSQYINDLSYFNENGDFPYNAKLEQSLGKMKSSKKITIFRGPVKPILKK